MLEYLLKLEMSFYIKETLENPQYMDQILHEDFIKVGSCGKTFTKDYFLDYKEQSYKVEFPFTNLSIKELSNGTFLITYHATFSNEEKSIQTKRSSLWICDGPNCQMTYHQGTYSKL